jgi:hypothetical protein
MIGQDVYPEFLADHRSGFAPYDLPPQHRLDDSEIPCAMPPVFSPWKNL